MIAELAFQLRWSGSNLRRRLARSLLSVTGIAIAVALALGLTAFASGYRRALDRGVEQLGFEVLVTAKGCPYEAASLYLRGGSIPMYIDEALATTVASDAEVESSCRLFLQAVRADDRHLLVMGVDDSFRAMKPWLALATGDWFDAPDAMQVVLGSNAATELELDAGDEFRVPGIDRALRVTGVLSRAGGQDDGTVFLPLRTAQKLFDQKDRLTGIGVKVRDIARLPDYLARVHELPGVQVISMRQAEQMLLNLASAAWSLMAVIGVLVGAGAVAALINTLLMSLLERRDELALLRALGARGRQLFASVVMEAEILCVLGAGLGVALALVSAASLEAVLRELVPFGPRESVLAIDGASLAIAASAALAAGALCAIYPALRARTVAARGAVSRS